jgi:putative transposase
MGPLKINLSQAFAGQEIGVKQVEEKIWLVSFMRYDLGFDDPLSPPYPCLRYKTSPM